MFWRKKSKKILNIDWRRSYINFENNAYLNLDWMVEKSINEFIRHFYVTFAFWTSYGFISFHSIHQLIENQLDSIVCLISIVLNCMSNTFVTSIVLSHFLVVLLRSYVFCFSEQNIVLDWNFFHRLNQLWFYLVWHFFHIFPVIHTYSTASQQIHTSNKEQKKYFASIHLVL